MQSAPSHTAAAQLAEDTIPALIQALAAEHGDPLAIRDSGGSASFAKLPMTASAKIYKPALKELLREPIAGSA